VAKDEERIAGASKIEAPSEQNVEKKPSDATAKLDANTTKDSAPEGHCAHDAFFTHAFGAPSIHALQVK
jgi:hypothetical protein